VVSRSSHMHGDWPLVRALIAPGMWLERLTTAEPAPDQIEVAQAAMQAALEAEEEEAGSPSTTLGTGGE